MQVNNNNRPSQGSNNNNNKWVINLSRVPLTLAQERSMWKKWKAYWHNQLTEPWQQTPPINSRLG